MVASYLDSLGFHMDEAWTHQLETWHEFFILVGTAGLTLTGLLFVVISLGPRVAAERRAAGVRAFVSPNAVYFTSALVVSALLLVPALPATVIGVLLCVGACASLLYLLYTRAHRQWRSGKLSLLDWIWFVGLPPLSYFLLLCAGVGFLVDTSFALYGVATSLVLLIVIGIRNAWDLVLWTAQQQHTK
jgi:hypothetical protein